MSRKEVNYWRDDACAKAFWSQHEVAAYRELNEATIEWLDPAPGERWLDLGCGAGRLTAALWSKSGGTLAEAIGLDVAPLNAKAYEKLDRESSPPANGKIKFQQADLSRGLPWTEPGVFDGAVSGLAIQYCESYDEATQTWNSKAYDRILADVNRALRPGGRFVFSVNVPEPSWRRVAMETLRGFWSMRKKGWMLLKLWRINRYGGWLKREARKGRFHYLPATEIAEKLEAAGFVNLECRLSFAQQAFLFRCRKPAVAKSSAA